MKSGNIRRFASVTFMYIKLAEICFQKLMMLKLQLLLQATNATDAADVTLDAAAVNVAADDATDDAGE